MEINILLLKRLFKDCMTTRSPCQNKYNILQRIDDGHSSFNKSKCLKRTDGCNYGSEINRVLLKNRMTNIALRNT